MKVFSKEKFFEDLNLSGFKKNEYLSDPESWPMYCDGKAPRLDKNGRYKIGPFGICESWLVDKFNPGRWIKVNPNTKSYKYKCPDCGGIVYMIGTEYPYCPYCMADMKGE